MIQVGKICLAELPQVDGKRKKRPILVLSKLPGRSHWLVCGISGKTYDFVSGFDENIHKETSFFNQTGLKTSSSIKLGYVSYLEEGKIEGVLGEQPHSLYISLIYRFINHLKLNLK